MMQLRIRVNCVDHDGFLGREFHPTAAHIGMHGYVTNLDLIAEDDPKDFRGDKYETYPAALRDGCQLFHVVLDNGDRVELLGHEIELVSATHDQDL